MLLVVRRARLLSDAFGLVSDARLRLLDVVSWFVCRAPNVVCSSHVLFLFHSSNASLSCPADVSFVRHTSLLSGARFVCSCETQVFSVRRVLLVVRDARLVSDAFFLCRTRVFGC